MQSMRLSQGKAHPSIGSRKATPRLGLFLICLKVRQRPLSVLPDASGSFLAEGDFDAPHAIDHYGLDRFDHRSPRGLDLLPTSFIGSLSQDPLRLSAILRRTPSASTPRAFFVHRVRLRSCDHTTSNVWWALFSTAQ
jgi:hypothetical protein